MSGSERTENETLERIELTFPMTVHVLPAAQAGLATALLCEAFADYPVMRYVLGTTGDYAKRLQTLIGFFVAARVLREDLILGTFDPAQQLVGVALVTLPGDREPPEALVQRREVVWQELGAAERGRYEAYSKAAGHFGVPVPQHHLNMIGVRPASLGSGYARVLLDYVHQLAADHPRSDGVSLSTETSANLSLYEHFGYRRLGYAKVSPELETWVFYRANPGSR
jgi:GNAT superfamily N-acetyltransferase